MHRIRLAMALTLALTLLAIPASAEDPCLDGDGNLELTEEVNWIKAPDHKLGNLAGTGAVDYPTWSDEEPATSVTGGAGGGTLQARAGNPLGTEYNPEGSGHFEGTFSGCLDTIAIDLYFLNPAQAAVGGEIVTKSQLFIDGTPVFIDSSDPAHEFNVEADGDTGALYKLRFAYTGIHKEMSTWPQDFEPLDSEHTITLTLFSQYVNPEQQAFYVYDTTEAPSSLSFNTYELDDYTQIVVGA